MIGHDRFIRREMKHTERARELFEFFLTPALKQQLVLEGLEPLPNEQINPKLKELITDMTFRVPLKDFETCICLIFEHKSKGALESPNAVDLPFQMLEQEVSVMRWFRDNHPDRKYPIVYPIGFYHGTKAYDGPLTVAENMLGPEHMKPDRWKNQTMTLIDLSKYDDAQLRGMGRLGLFLLTLKHIYDKNLIGFVREVLPLMQDMDTTENRDFLISLFTYLIQALPEVDHDEMGQIAVKSFTEATGGAYMTIADRWMREGAEKERKLAEKRFLEEKKQIALNLIRKGVDLETVLQSTGIPLAELEKLTRPKAS